MQYTIGRASGRHHPLRNEPLSRETGTLNSQTGVKRATRKRVRQ